MASHYVQHFLSKPDMVPVKGTMKFENREANVRVKVSVGGRTGSKLSSVFRSKPNSKKQPDMAPSARGPFPAIPRPQMITDNVAETDYESFYEDAPSNCVIHASPNIDPTKGNCPTASMVRSDGNEECDTTKLEYDGNRPLPIPPPSKFLSVFKSKPDSKKQPDMAHSARAPLPAIPIPQVNTDDVAETDHLYENYDEDLPWNEVCDVSPGIDTTQENKTTAAMVRSDENGECDTTKLEYNIDSRPPIPAPRKNRIDRSTIDTDSLYVNTKAAAMRGSDEQGQLMEEGESEFEIYGHSNDFLCEQTEQMTDRTEPEYEPINPNNSEPLNEESDSGPDSFEKEMDDIYTRYQGRKHREAQEYSEAMPVLGIPTLVRDPKGGPSRLSWKDINGKEIVMLVNVEEKPGK